MALSGPRLTPMRGSYKFEAEALVAAGAVLYQGALAALSGGYLVAGAAATGLANPCIVDTDNGQRSVDNTNGADGAVTARVFFTVAAFKSAGGGDQLAQADVGATVYIVDDETVGKTDGTGTRSAAGVLMNVDSDGYWVSLRHP